MPELRLIVASGTGQRRLLEETANNLQKKGYVMSARQEGGEWQPLLSDNMSGGLFDEDRLIVVDSAELMGAMPENLSTLVEAESSVVILLVYSADPSRLFPKEVYKKCKILKPAEFPRWPRERQMWVEDIARKTGINISRDAVAMIVELIDDPEEIRGQLTALHVLKGKNVINIEDVETLCLDDGSKNLLRVLDGMCRGDAPTVMKSLMAMSRDAKEGDIIKLISAIHNRMRLAWYAAMYPKQGALFAKSLGARDYAWKMAVQAARRYGPVPVGRFVLGIIKMNIDEKSGTSAGWNNLETLVMQLMGK
jgi:DNA polymerase III delta subunit